MIIKIKIHQCFKKRKNNKKINYKFQKFLKVNMKALIMKKTKIKKLIKIYLTQINQKQTQINKQLNSKIKVVDLVQEQLKVKKFL